MSTFDSSTFFDFEEHIDHHQTYLYAQSILEIFTSEHRRTCWDLLAAQKKAMAHSHPPKQPLEKLQSMINGIVSSQHPYLYVH
jgi:hypothetical protein